MPLKGMCPRTGPRFSGGGHHLESRRCHGNNYNIRVASDGARTRPVGRVHPHQYRIVRRQDSPKSITHTVILARPFIGVARPQTQEPSSDKTPVRDERERTEPANVPDAAEKVGPYGKTQTDDEAGGHGEHDRDGTAACETVTVDVFEILAVHGRSEYGDGELDREFGRVAHSRSIAAFVVVVVVDHDHVRRVTR